MASELGSESDVGAVKIRIESDGDDALAKSMGAARQETEKLVASVKELAQEGSALSTLASSMQAAGKEAQQLVAAVQAISQAGASLSQAAASMQAIAQAAGGGGSPSGNLPNAAGGGGGVPPPVSGIGGAGNAGGGGGGGAASSITAAAGAAAALGSVLRGVVFPAGLALGAKEFLETVTRLQVELIKLREQTTNAGIGGAIGLLNQAAESRIAADSDISGIPTNLLEASSQGSAQKAARASFVKSSDEIQKLLIETNRKRNTAASFPFGTQVGDFLGITPTQGDIDQITGSQEILALAATKAINEAVRQDTIARSGSAQNLFKRIESNTARAANGRK